MIDSLAQSKDTLSYTERVCHNNTKHAMSFSSMSSVSLVRSLFCHLLVLIVFFVLVTSNEEYKCPPNQFYLFPCRCLQGGYKGLEIVCDNANLASISLAIQNIKLPINNLVVSNANITRFFGHIFKDKVVFTLRIENSTLREIDQDVLVPLKESLRSIELRSNRFHSIPDSFNNVLTTNLTRLMIIDTASLVEVKASALKKLTSLIELDLHNNSIRKIDSSALHPLSTLGKCLWLRDDQFCK